MPLCHVNPINFSVLPAELSTSSLVESHTTMKRVAPTSDASLLVSEDRRHSPMIGENEKKKIKKQERYQRRRRRRAGAYFPCCSPCCCLSVGLAVSLLLAGLAALLFLLLSNDSMTTTKTSISLSLSITCFSLFSVNSKNNSSTDYKHDRHQ
jgi:hypothetical protein